MYEYEWNSMPCMQMMSMPDYCYPMMTMPQQQLESMYPKVYIIIFPVVRRHCDMMDMKYGVMHIPTREQLDSMVDSIVKTVSSDVELAIAEGVREEERQLGLGGRRLLRDLVLILLLRELIRRRGQYWGYYGYPGGMYGTYGGYPGGYPIY
ncbi:MAG: hypothetical protein HPY74_18475 [Firmicutes bacterium]|nr:hypothetical protein [Bacillota bacterium]